eukprot:4772484-Amphidinium_carterae.1
MLDKAPASHRVQTRGRMFANTVCSLIRMAIAQIALPRAGREPASLLPSDYLLQVLVFGKMAKTWRSGQ